MLVSLPYNLETAIEQALKPFPVSQWVSAAQNLSERYRAEQVAPTHKREVSSSKKEALATGNRAALGYIAQILPATYAQLYGAMAATKARISPEWQPVTLLDIGSGPGTAFWAAKEIWPSLSFLTAWEREPAFIQLGQQLAKASDETALQNIQWRQINLENLLPQNAPNFDLIVLGHVLNEMDAELQSKLVLYAWEHCNGILLIVEPGTSAAFPVVRAMRDLLLEKGAKTLAPCAHDKTCPLVNDWCHFPQRLNRPNFQRRAKAASAGWEESKFSYCAMARFEAESEIWGRLIHQPHLNKAYAELIVSSQDGIVRPRIPKRDRAAYNEARDLDWGDVLFKSPPTSP